MQVRSRWDVLTLILLGYVCIAAPLIICFGIEYSWLDWLGYIEITVEVAFCLDVRPQPCLCSRRPNKVRLPEWSLAVCSYSRCAMQIYLNFRTALDIDGSLIVDRKTIAKLYLKGWFAVDFISVIPFQEIVTAKSLGFVQLLKGAKVCSSLLRTFLSVCIVVQAFSKAHSDTQVASLVLILM